MCYLDHFVALGLGVPSGHGKDPDLLGLGTAVGQRQGHLPVGGAVCGVGPGETRENTRLTTVYFDRDFDLALNKPK